MKTLCCISVNYIVCEWQNFDFKIRSDNKKNSYKRRVYESVDGISLSYVIAISITDEQKNSCKQRVEGLHTPIRSNTVSYKSDSQDN